MVDAYVLQMRTRLPHFMFLRSGSVFGGHTDIFSSHVLPSLVTVFGGHTDVFPYAMLAPLETLLTQFRKAPGSTQLT